MHKKVVLLYLLITSKTGQIMQNNNMSILVRLPDDKEKLVIDAMHIFSTGDTLHTYILRKGKVDIRKYEQNTEISYNITICRVVNTTSEVKQ